MRTRLILAGALVLAAALMPAWAAPRVGIPSRLWLEPIETAAVAGQDLRLVRVGYAQGLRGVASLGSLDGALFVLDAPASIDAGMGTYDTRTPLDMVFLDPSGWFIARYTMSVCEGEDCPTFYPTRT